MALAFAGDLGEVEQVVPSALGEVGMHGGVTRVHNGRHHYVVAEEELVVDRQCLEVVREGEEEGARNWGATLGRLEHERVQMWEQAVAKAEGFS